jgi:hypothetical protein
MRPLCKRRLLVACFLCSAAVAGAQQTQGTAAVTAVPRLVHFAGSFHPPVNQPAGPVGATFAIYSEQEGGTPLWTEDQNVELDASGNYTVMLGVTKNGGVPPELFAVGEARWLQVKFYAPGEVDLSRVLLVSVPYALKAGDADTLGGKPASAYLLAGSSTSAQPEGPSGAAQPAQPEAALSARTAAGVKPAFTSIGTTNYVPKFTDASGDVGNSVMFQNGSNIGVGTTAAGISMDVRPTATSPYAQLGVAQTVDHMTLFASDTFGPAFYWDPTKALRFGTGGTGLYSATQFTEYMRIQPNGYVGIGTQTPAATLDVAGDVNLSGSLQLQGTTVLQFPGGLKAGDISVGPGALSNAGFGYAGTRLLALMRSPAILPEWIIRLWELQRSLITWRETITPLSVIRRCISTLGEVATHLLAPTPLAITPRGTATRLPARARSPSIPSVVSTSPMAPSHFSPIPAAPATRGSARTLWTTTSPVWVILP